MIRAVLFDMGSTLLEFEHRPWEEVFRDALRAAYDHLRERLGPLPPFDRFEESFREAWTVFRGRARASGVEVPLDRVFAEALSRCGSRVHGRDLPALLRAHYAPVAREVTVFPDAVATLVGLRRSGYRIGLVSNTIWPGEFHRDDLARFELLPLFDVTVFSSEVGFAKPDPRIFRAVLRDLGVEPHEAVFVGDRPEDDVTGARAAGMRAILRRHPRRQIPAGLRAEAAIDRLEEIPGILRAWSPAPASP